MNITTSDVKIEGNKAVLEVQFLSYKNEGLSNEERDRNSETFVEVLGGRQDTTEEQAKEEIIRRIKSSVANMEADGWDVCVWIA